jgi:hypothetical protein
MDPLFTKLFLCGLAVTVLLTLIEWLCQKVRTRRWRGAVEPRCRTCGYVICPNAGRICPECGGDLRKIGVVVSGKGSRPIYPLGVIIGSGVTLAAVGLPIGWLLEDTLPGFFSEYEATISIDSGKPTTLPSDSPDIVEVTARGKRNLRHQLPATIDACWWVRDRDGPHWEVEAYHGTRRGWDLEWGPPGRHDAAVVAVFDQAMAERFVTLGGVDSRSVNGQRLAAEVLSAILKLQRGEFPIGRTVISADGRPISAMRYRRDSFWSTLALAFAVWLPTWLLIASLVRGRYAKLTAMAIAQEQTILDGLRVPRA